jgi:hypothetical protein
MSTSTTLTLSLKFHCSLFIIAAFIAALAAVVAASSNPQGLGHDLDEVSL